MDKVLVLGRPGSGKSTFARKLKEKTNLPLYYLDQLFWNEDKTHVSREVLDQRIDKVMENDFWIIDGNYIRTMEKRIVGCDTIFLFDIKIEESLSGIEKRLGKKREDLPWIEEEFDCDFKEYVINFDIEQKDYIYSLIEKYKDEKDVYIFKTREESDLFVSGLNNR